MVLKAGGGGGVVTQQSLGDQEPSLSRSTSTLLGLDAALSDPVSRPLVTWSEGHLAFVLAQDCSSFSKLLPSTPHPGCTPICHHAQLCPGLDFTCVVHVKFYLVTVLICTS